MSGFLKLTNVEWITDKTYSWPMLFNPERITAFEGCYVSKPGTNGEMIDGTRIWVDGKCWQVLATVEQIESLLGIVASKDVDEPAADVRERVRGKIREQFAFWDSKESYGRDRAEYFGMEGACQSIESVLECPASCAETPASTPENAVAAAE